MNIFESICSAFSNVFSNKMRTFLTMLGIIIGISSVIMITSIGNGVSVSLNNEFSKIKSNLLGIYFISWNTVVKDDDRLDFDDVELLQKHSNVNYVAPIYTSNAKTQKKNPSEEQICSVIGTVAEYQQSGDMDLLYGRFLNNRDYATKSNVIVIDEILAEIVFGRKDVIGEKINIEFSDTNKDATIIGVLKSEKSMMVSMYSSCTVFMPINTLNDIVNEDTKIDNLYIGVKDISKIEKTGSELIRMLEVKHDNIDEEKYGIESYMDQVKMVTNTIGMITKFISFVAAISLLVGGVGVMNIMLVTVTERTREIGIRKSLGATNSNIRVQFLIEAMILSAIGGVIGILLGYAGGLGVGAIITQMGTEITPIISLPVVIGTVLISSFIGILFGVYPASKAAKLDPIEALRYE